MSLAYCFYCLARIDECECPARDNEDGRVVYGDRRVSYIKGYRDAKDGKEMEI